jgi:hypothetical protein
MGIDDRFAGDCLSSSQACFGSGRGRDASSMEYLDRQMRNFQPGVWLTGTQL